MKKGTHVVAYRESGSDGEIAHYLEEDGDKGKLQLGDGAVVRYAYREPADYDEAGSGQTYHSIG